MAGRPKVFSGARAIIKINGRIVAYAMSVRWDVRHENKELRVIDSLLPQEIMMTGLSVSLVCTSLRVPNKSATQLQFEPTVMNLLQQGYATIELKDRATDATIIYVPRASLVRRSGVVAAKQLSTETWVFKGIGFWDEQEPEKAL